MKPWYTILTLLALALALTGCGKPDIEASCTMNGWGSGKCEFLNNGNGEGSQTIHIAVRNHKLSYDVGSTTLKSGLIKAGDVRTRQFLVSEVNGGCKADFSKDEMWADVCSFTVTPVQ